MIGADAQSFFQEVARYLRAVTNEQQSVQFLIQRMAVAIQRGNAAAILGSIGDGS